nr:MAG TPA: Formiminotransferase domain [Caudoviricetes sp.]
MDAVEFLNEGTRMCNSYEACVGCPMWETDDCCMVSMNLKRMINIVEQWAKEHPVKTRQSEFFEDVPECEEIVRWSARYLSIKN